MCAILDPDFDECTDIMVAKPDYSGPCDDDYEYTAPYVGMCPNESYKENGSPIRFYCD